MFKEDQARKDFKKDTNVATEIKAERSLNLYSQAVFLGSEAFFITTIN